MRFARQLILIAVMVGLGMAASHADVIFKGKVEYWDRISNTYRPAKKIHVEIEGDWWEPYLDVQTDTSGNYYKKFRDPHWGDFDDVDIEAYAETPDLLEIKESWYSLWPYHAISYKTHNVDGGETVTINLKIGGPNSNAAEAYYKSMAETANAFVVHQEMLAHYDRLCLLGAPSSILDDKTVIVPAMGIASYYNHLTENINIVIDGPSTGYVNWATIEDEGQSSYLNYHRFKETMRHELSHGIHDDMTLAFLVGLNSPSSHNLTGSNHETNRWIAYTEGWAAFLPAATLNQGGLLELSRPPGGLDIPDSGDHYAKEGDVAGLFWDIFDGSSLEIMDIPARKTYDGAHDLPATVIEEQVWNDILTDPNLSRIRSIVSKGMDSIQEFLESYVATYPGDKYGIKAIAINRGITQNVPSESPATLSGTPTISRAGDTVTIAFTVKEPNAEDRPHVRVTAWHQRSGGTTSKKSDLKLTIGWNGDSRPGTLVFNVPSGTGTPDVAWVVVNDGMRPTAYRMEVPAPRPSGSTGPLPQPLRADILSILTKPVTTSIPRVVLDEPTPEDISAVQTLRKYVKTARAELRAYAERKEDAFQADKLLFKIGTQNGGLQGVTSPVDINFKAPRLGGPDTRTRQAPNPQAEASRKALHQWQDQLAGGKPLAKPLTPAAKRDLLPYRQRLEKHARDQEASASKAAQLNLQLDAALTGVKGRSRGSAAQKNQQIEGADHAVQQIKKALQDAAADSDLSRSLKRQSAALGQAAR